MNKSYFHILKEMKIVYFLIFLCKGLSYNQNDQLICILMAQFLLQMEIEK